MRFMMLLIVLVAGCDIVDSERDNRIDTPLFATKVAPLSVADSMNSDDSAGEILEVQALLPTEAPPVEANTKVFEALDGVPELKEAVAATFNGPMSKAIGSIKATNILLPGAVTVGAKWNDRMGCAKESELVQSAQKVTTMEAETTAPSRPDLNLVIEAIAAKGGVSKMTIF